MTEPEAFRSPDSSTHAGRSEIVKTVLLVLVCSSFSSAATWYVIKFNPATALKESTAAAIASESAPMRAEPSRQLDVPDQPSPVPAEPAEAAVPSVAVAAPPTIAPPPAPAPFDQAAFFSSQGPATLQDVANASLSVAQTVGQDESFVAPNTHSALYRDLKTLEALSTSVLQDNGSDPATSASMAGALSSALDETISRTGIIAQRPTETPEAVQKTVQLQALLQAIKSRQPQL